MDTQTLLTVAAVAGPLVGVALGAYLASRSQQSHWSRDRRLDAFVAAQTAVYRVIAASLVAGQYDPPQPEDLAHKQIRLGLATDLRDTSTQWGEACERLDLLAGASVQRTSAELRQIVRTMVDGAVRNDAAAVERLVETARTLRARLTVEMRNELKTGRG